jgi:serine protease
VRLRPLVTAILVLLGAWPAAARAATPGEVVVRHAGAASPQVRHVADVATAVRRLRARRDVVYAVPNVPAHASAFVPNDPGRGATAGGWQNVQWNFTGPFSVNAPDAWQHLIDARRPGAQGVTVAVLDTGVAYRKRAGYLKSPDLSTTHFVRGWDFVDDDPYPYDRNGHGTHVASTIAETTDNGVGLTGLAYRATILPVRVLDNAGEGDAAKIARGIRFAARRGADVINLSLEFDVSVGAGEIPELLEAVRFARGKGAVVVGASGNEGYPTVAYPAKAGAVVSVGATTERGCLSDFSNVGRGLDIVAPGGGADAPLSDDANCKPDDPAGHDIYQVTLEGSKTRRRFGIPGDYEGTSMAAPHVSAVAAMIIASGVVGAHPAPSAVERRLKDTARDLGTPGYDRRYGYGLIDAAAATAPPGSPPPAPAPPPAPDPPPAPAPAAGSQTPPSS